MGRWGSGLFQGDQDFDMASELCHEAGLEKLEEEARAKAVAEGMDPEDAEMKIFYSLYGGPDSELIRKHLDSGVLTKMIKDKEEKLLSRTRGLDRTDSWYGYVLLGACAMTLGCHLPDSFLSMLKKVYTEVELMPPTGPKQMKKALFGPDGFKNGVPYEFESKSLLETANALEDPESDDDGDFDISMMGNPSTSKVIKELCDKYNKPDVCGACGAKSREDGEALLTCARCKERKYCNRKCQKKHWKVHKKVCEAVAQ